MCLGVALFRAQLGGVTEAIVGREVGHSALSTTLSRRILDIGLCLHSIVNQDYNKVQCCRFSRTFARDLEPHKGA